MERVTHGLAPGHDGAHDPRAVRIRDVLEACLCRRAAGESMSDDEICAAHPELLPELAEGLRSLRVIERARTSRTRPTVDALRGVVAGELPVPRDAFPGYELLREIHRGGQGVIYRAVQRSTGRKVAVKVLLDGAFAGPVDRARFEREVEALAALQHQNIVTIHDSGSAAGRFFFVMDYIAGQPLDLYMSSERRSIEESLRIFLKICDAVNAAHVHGIIHRDLKPANIRVNERGEPYILDFGLARVAAGAAGETTGDHAAMTMTGQFVGSLPWAAPEQTDGSPARIDTRSDVYALGVVLYQMLTGKFPYSVVGPVHEVMQRIVSEAPQSPRKLRPEIGDELATMVLKCLAKERERRYQTAGELARDLERYQRGEPIEAKRDSAWYMLRKSLQRFRLLLTVAALFALVLTVSSVVTWSLWRSASVRETEARENLWGALVSQARAVRRSDQMGRRERALDAITRAATIRPNLELRNEMIAALAIIDAVPRALPVTQDGTAVFDSTLERCAVLDEVSHDAMVIRVADGHVLARIPGLPVGSQLHQSAVGGAFFVRVFDTPNGPRTVEAWRIVDGPMVMRIDDVPPLGGFDVTKDGLTLAVARADQAIHLYDLASGTHRQRIPLDRMPSRMSFDPTGRRLALFHGAYERAAILDLATGACESVFAPAHIGWCCAWSPDCAILAGGENDQIQLWDLIGRRSIGTLRGHESVITHLAFSPDGTRLLSRSWDGISILWDVTAHRAIFKAAGSFAHFSPNGLSIAGFMAFKTDHDRVARPTIMDLTGDAFCRSIAGMAGPNDLGINRPIFARHDALIMNIVTTYSRPDLCGLYLIGSRSGRQLIEFIPGVSGGAALDSDGRSLSAYVEGRGLLRWPVSDAGGALQLGAAQQIHRGERWLAGGRSTDDRTLVYSERPGAVKVLSVEDPESVREFACEPGDDVRAVSAAARLVVTAEWHKQGARIWDTQSGRRVASLPTRYTNIADFSPDDRWLVTCDSEQLRVWDTQSWENVSSVTGVHQSPTYSPDGRFIAAVVGDGLRLLDARTLEELCTLESPERMPITGVDISSDCTRIVQMTHRPGIGCIWDLRKIREQLAMLGLDWELPPYPPPEEEDALTRMPAQAVGSGY